MNQEDPKTEREAQIAGKILDIDEAPIRSHLDKIVLQSVEESLNALPNSETDRHCGAGSYERSAGRVNTQTGRCQRKIHTKARESDLKVPKLGSLPLETQIMERYKWRDSSVAEVSMEMSLAIVSVRRVENITASPCGEHVDAEIVLQEPREGYPDQKPRVISDNDPQLLAKDFKEFIRICEMNHVRIGPDEGNRFSSSMKSDNHWQPPKRGAAKSRKRAPEELGPS